MKTSIRSLLVLASLAIVLVACGTTPGASDPGSSVGASSTPLPSVPTSHPPSDGPSDEPEPSPTPAGTLTIVGAAVDGPGTPLAEALQGSLAEPVFVNGVIFLDIEGNVWFADSLVDASVPTFGDVRVRVEGFPNDGPTWDMDDPNVVGLQEANGILFKEDAQLYGTVTP